MPDLNTYDLPPAQALVLEVLAARARLGENRWPLPNTCHHALEALSRRGLIGWQGGNVPKTASAWLTARGRELVLSETYDPPLTFTRDRLTDALTRLEVKVTLTGPIAGMINAEAMADAIIEALGYEPRKGENENHA